MYGIDLFLLYLGEKILTGVYMQILSLFVNLNNRLTTNKPDYPDVPYYRYAEGQ